MLAPDMFCNIFARHIFPKLKKKITLSCPFFLNHIQCVFLAWFFFLIISVISVITRSTNLSFYCRIIVLISNISFFFFFHFPLCIFFFFFLQLCIFFFLALVFFFGCFFAFRFNFQHLYNLFSYVSFPPTDILHILKFCFFEQDLFL